MNSLSDLLEIFERIKMMTGSGGKILEVAKDYPPQINEHSVMYFQLSTFFDALDVIIRQHEEAFVDLEFELKPEAPEKYDTQT